MTYFDKTHPDSEEHIEDLKRSIVRVGHLEPIIKNMRTGNIVSGSHRLEADPNWPVEEVDIDDFEEEIVAIHYNLQRRMSQAETVARIKRILEKLETRGTHKEECLKEVLDSKIFPWGEDYIRSLAPKEFVRSYEQRSPSYLSRVKTRTKTLEDAIARVVKAKAKGEAYGYILQQMNPGTGKPFYQEIANPAKFTEALNNGAGAHALLIMASSVAEPVTEHSSHRQLLSAKEAGSIFEDDDGIQYRIYVIKEEGKPVRFDGEQV